MSRLTQAIEEFTLSYYSSYLAHADEQTRTKLLLATLESLALADEEQGPFLLEEEELEASMRMEHLLTEFRSGHLRPHELGKLLEPVLARLTESNPKARLIAYAAQLEDLLCLRPHLPYPEEMREKAREILSHITTQVTPSLADYKAQAVAQGLMQLMTHPELLHEPISPLVRSFEGWLTPFAA